MASAEETYVDPSALRSLYVHDDRSGRFCGWRKRVGGALPLTRLGRAELVNSMRLAVHRGALDDAAAAAAIADLDEDLKQGRLTLMDASWRRALDLAATYSDRYTAKLGTRSLDVLHVAMAVSTEMRCFVSYDDRQQALAAKVGLRVISP